MTEHDQVRECADKCAMCHRKPHLIVLAHVTVLECPSLAHPLVRVERPQLDECLIAWNVRQRKAKV